MSYNSKYKGSEVDAALDLAKTALQEHQDISGKQDVISDLATIRSGAEKGATAVQPSDLADVAISGSYNDLSNKPTIPSAVTEATVTGWGFTKNTGTYSKPSTGIPKTDLASAVQTSLGKADTALQSIPSEYVTETELTNKGYATTSAMNTALADKVDKVSGKGLSTNDFTTALKTKLEGLSNYDDTAINNAIDGLQDQLDTLVSGDTDAAIESFNEIIAFLEGVQDTETLEGIIASIEQQIAGKQDTISDLATIRSGASKGASAVQSSDLATVATSGSYDDLSNKPTIPTVNDATLTIQKNGTSVGTFTANASAAKTINIMMSKSDVGLGNVDNTADTDKSVSHAETSGSATKATQDASGNVITTTYATKSELTTGLAGKQNTITNNVTYSGTLTSGQVAIYDGTAGKIKSSGYTIATSVPSGAKFTDTTYSSKAAASGGTDVSLVTTGEKYTWNSKASTSVATTSANGLMSSTDKSKLDGIATGAEVNVQSDWNATSGDAFIKNKPSLATVATSGSYDDLSDKPTIPTVNNGTLTIQRNGKTIVTFEANQRTTSFADITVPTKMSELENDSGFKTTDNNTTYTFAGGTNKFTVTPSGGTAQDVAVTPSISNATTSSAGLMSAADKTKLNNAVISDGTVLKVVYVSTLPDSPDSTTLYIIPE